ncbi:MAG TPA: glycosyltransferase family 61 protein [Pseudolabrys sp.]|nr:glycosyltransferase family 61 protein [Pseudolabrys sp.]
MMDLPIEFYALRRNVRRAILGPGTLESTAVDREIICPAERVEVLPAIYLPGQIERVTGSPPESTKELEIEHATRRTVTHAETIAYHIRNAVLIDGLVFANQLKFPLRSTSIGTLTAVNPVHLEKAAIASSLLGNKYFGHWLRDDCSTYILAKQFSEPLCIEPSFAAPHIDKYREYFDQEWSYTQRAYIDHLIVFQDYGQNRSKRDRYMQLNKKIVRLFGNKRTPLVYLRRGNNGAPRPVENERELIELLSRRGAVVVDVEAQTLESLLESLASAQIVVSMEGSHLAHCAFSVPKKSGILVLQPPDRFASIHRDWTMCLGVRFGFVVGTRGASGYVFSGTEVERTLDLLINSI